MPYKIIVGRDDADLKKLGDKGTIFLGRHYVKMGQTTSLSSNVYLDVAGAHVILISGKRGSGKSHSLGVIAEEMSNLPEEISQNLAVLIIDTMGIFWTMKYPNTRDEELLESWSLKPTQLSTIDIYCPTGYFKRQKQEGIPVDYKFSIKTSELDGSDWCNTFGITLTEPIGILIERIISDLKENKEDYGIDDIIEEIRNDKREEKNVKDATENRFLAAKSWGLFSKEGTEIKDIIKSGRVSVLDVSVYSKVSGEWGIKNLVIGLLAKKLLMERMFKRRVEEIESIEAGKSYFGYEKEFKEKEEMPLIWICVDEAHEVLPKEGKTAATDALVQLIREGRQPGISMVLATQQPGEIHKDVITQSDIVLSHRVTARRDINALNNIMQTYLRADIQRYLNELPRLKGSAIILDDNSERIYPMRVRPRLTWHGGESPTAVHIKRKELLDLGL